MPNSGKSKDQLKGWGPVGRWVNNVYEAGKKLQEKSGVQTAFGPTRKDNLKEQTEARGQAWGALLQNRTYDSKGKRK